jgi:hypothetical protein
MTTHNRPEVREEHLAQWKRYLPSHARFFLVDDASAVPADGADFRFETNVGIATAKNKCIELCMDAGADDIFLTDDDAAPKDPDWWRPYVSSPYGHLMYLKGLRPLWRSATHWAAKRPRGGILYYHRSVVDVVGGMRTEFPRWGDEHIELSNRIHNVGLTPYPYMDVIGSEYLWRYDRTQESSVPLEERTSYAEQRRAVMDKYRGSKDFVEYRGAS